MILPDWINSSKNVLVAPLNWGLGHATRCIPIINYLVEKGKEVIIASDGGALQLLKEEFPELVHHEIPGYNIHYKYGSMSLNMVLQSWKMLTGIRAEKSAIGQLIREHKIDTIISDNRYGVIHEACRNVIICHQINIMNPIKMVGKIASSVNHRWINRFDECWIPDYKGPSSLAGDLSQSKKIHHPFYLGAISRFKKLNLPIKRKWLIILSGPEPVRTRLESQLATLFHQEEYLLVRGLPGAHTHEDKRWVSHLPAHQLNKEICQSELVICRSGYTSIMDLFSLKQKAILIPTPGQGEQEYLGKLLAERHHHLFSLVSENNLEDYFNDLAPGA